MLFAWQKVLPGIVYTAENSLMALACQLHILYVRSICKAGLIPKSFQLKMKVTLVNLISKFGRVPKSFVVNRCFSAVRAVDVPVFV